MVTSTNNTEIIENQIDQGVNSNNSYEELKLQVEELKNEYYEEFGKKFDYFLFIDNSNHHLVEKQGEILGLIKSNSDLDREEALSSIQGVDSKVFQVISNSNVSTVDILQEKR